MSTVANSITAYKNYGRWRRRLLEGEHGNCQLRLSDINSCCTLIGQRRWRPSTSCHDYPHFNKVFKQNLPQFNVRPPGACPRTQTNKQTKREPDKQTRTYNNLSVIESDISAIWLDDVGCWLTSNSSSGITYVSFF